MSNTFAKVAQALVAERGRDARHHEIEDDHSQADGKPAHSALPFSAFVAYVSDGQKADIADTRLARRLLCLNWSLAKSAMTVIQNAGTRRDRRHGPRLSRRGTRRNRPMHSVESRVRPSDVVGDRRLQWAGRKRNGHSNRHARDKNVTRARTTRRD
jgi:hypothetical protein